MGWVSYKAQFVSSARPAPMAFGPQLTKIFSMKIVYFIFSWWDCWMSGLMLMITSAVGVMGIMIIRVRWSCNGSGKWGASWGPAAAAVCVVYCWQLLFAQYLHNALIYDYPRRELEFLNFDIDTMIIDRQYRHIYKLFPPKNTTLVQKIVSECFVDKNPNFNMETTCLNDWLAKIVQVLKGVPMAKLRNPIHGEERVGQGNKAVVCW